MINNSHPTRTHPKTLTFRRNDTIKEFEETDAETSVDIAEIKNNLVHMLDTRIQDGVLESVQHWNRRQTELQGLDSNKQEIIRRMRRITKADKMFRRTGMSPEEIDDLWSDDVWSSVIDNRDKTFKEFILGEFMQSPADTTGINMFVVVLMRLFNPSFQFYCKNRCGTLASQTGATGPKTRKECREIEELFGTLGKYSTLLDKHFFLAFGCSFLGKQYTSFVGKS
jgi:hypothetical protein